MELLWSTGMRAGALVGLDLDDYVPEPGPEEKASGPSLDVRHRPETDAPLKNGKRGERTVASKPELAELLSDYVAHHRADKVDENGREPLFPTRIGRMASDSFP